MLGAFAGMKIIVALRKAKQAKWGFNLVLREDTNYGY
jgi:hypothetical protein